MRYRQTNKEKFTFVWGAEHVQCFTLFISSWKWSNPIFRIPFITCSLHWVECSSGTALSIFTQKKHCLLAQPIWNLSFLHLQNHTAFIQSMQQFVSHIDSRASHVSLCSSASDTPVEAVSAELQLSLFIWDTPHGWVRHPRPALTLPHQNTFSGLAQHEFSLGVCSATHIKHSCTQ